MRSTRLALALVATAATAALTGAMVWMFIGPWSHQHPHGASTPEPTVASVRAPTCSAQSVRSLLGPVFDWDSGIQSRQDVIRRVVAVADPSGIETPGLLADLDDYLPDQDIWRQLSRYQTRQTLTGIRLTVPRSWGSISRLRERLGAGTAAFTVRATRIRSGVVAGRRAAVSSQIVLTMFVRCPASAIPSGYRLLRLSQLGHPLP